MSGDFIFADFELDGDGQLNEKINQGELSETEIAFGEMRSVARSVMRRGESSNPFGEIFYRQGKILEFIDAEFGEKYIPEFYPNSLSYCFMPRLKRNFPVFHPCYQDMTDIHLQYYLWWRGEFRSGKYHKTTVPYLKLYAFELVNRIGGLPPKKTLARLIFLWKKIKEQEQHADYFMLDLIKSFYCVNDIEELSFECVLKNCPYYPSPATRISLSENYSDVYKLCSSRIPPKKLAGAFVLSKNGHYLEECLPVVFLAADTLLSREGIELRKLLTGSPSANTAWHPFRNVPYYTENEVSDRQVELTSTQWCVCRNGAWTSWAVLPGVCSTALLHYIYRVAEAAVRKYTCYSTQLRPSSAQLLAAAAKGSTAPQYKNIAENAELCDKIFEAVKAYLDNAGFVPPVTERKKKKAAEKPPVVVPVIEFDFSRLDGIRSDADYISERLVTDGENTQNDDVESVDRTAESDGTENGCYVEYDETEMAAEYDESGLCLLLSQLDDLRREAVKICLVSDEPEAELLSLARRNGTMPSVLIEEINTSALDTIGDILIENGGRPQIIEDYAEELRDKMQQAQ